MSNIIDKIQVSGVTYDIQGSGGGGITSGEVQTMIDESISGKADTNNTVQSVGLSTLANGKSITAVIPSGTTYTATIFKVGNGLTWQAYNSTIVVDTSKIAQKTDIPTVSSAITSGDTNPVQGGVLYDKFDEIEQVTAAALNELNDKIEEGGGGNPTVELTQAEYDALVSAGTVSADTYYIITDAQAVDLTNYYTKTETNTLLGGKADTATTYTKTEVDTALGGKQATLVSGTNIKTINNESILGSGNIDIQGGSTYTAGRGISIANDTISFNLPISADSNTYINAGVGNTNNNTVLNILIGSGNTAFNGNRGIITGGTTIGFGNQVGYIGRASFSKSYSFAFGYGNKINGGQSYAIGYNNNIGSGTNYSKDKSFLIGYYNTCTFNGDSSGDYIFGNYCTVTKPDEFALGKYNASNTGSTDADKTFFSIGNGTSTSARHNAFEIRQNGDIYFSYGGADIMLQNKIAELEEVIARALNDLNDRITAIENQLNI